MTDQIERIDQKVLDLLGELDQLDPKKEVDQLGRSLRIALNLAKNKAKQRERGHDDQHKKQN